MAMGQSAIRDYLRSKGLADNDITYGNGTVKVKNQNFMSATPQADGKTYASGEDLAGAYANYRSTLTPKPNPGMLATPKQQSGFPGMSGPTATDPGVLMKAAPVTQQGYQSASTAAPGLDAPWEERLSYYASNPQAANEERKRALTQYRLQTALGDTAGAAGAQDWMGKIETVNPQVDYKSEYQNALQSYQNQLMEKPKTVEAPAPFKFDQQTLQSDPTYQAYLQLAGQNAQSATNNAMGSLSRRGMGSSSLADTAANQIAQKYNAQVSSELVPKLYDQKYKEYQDNVDIGMKVNDTNYNRGNDYTKNLGSAFSTFYGLNSDEEAKALKDKEARIKYAQDKTKEFGKQVDVKNDYGLMDSQVKGIPTLEGQKTVADQQKTRVDQMLKSAESAGVFPNELSDYLGIPRGTTTLKTIELGIEEAYKKGSISIQQAAQAINASRLSLDQNKFGLEQDKFDWETDKNNPQNVLATENKQSLIDGRNQTRMKNIIDELDSSPYVTKQYDMASGKEIGFKVTDPGSMEKYILSQGLSDADARKAYKRYGLKWDGEK